HPHVVIAEKRECLAALVLEEVTELARKMPVASGAAGVQPAEATTLGCGVGRRAQRIEVVTLTSWVTRELVFARQRRVPLVGELIQNQYVRCRPGGWGSIARARGTIARVRSDRDRGIVSRALGERVFNGASARAVEAGVPVPQAEGLSMVSDVEAVARRIDGVVRAGAHVCRFAVLV